VNTARDDFFIDTTQYWSTPERAEGFFRTSGNVDVLVDPIIFPRLLTCFMGDPSSVGPGTGSSYVHTWKFGSNELYTAAGSGTGNPSACTGIKPFTVNIGQGIEKDRELYGCVIRGMSIEGVSREHVTCSLDLLGSGDEALVAAASPTDIAEGYADYKQPYYTFINTSTANITAANASNTNKLLSPGAIEAFRLNATRGINADYYPLGSRYLGDVILDGMAEVSGTMDFAFNTEKEHERFLADISSYETGDQPSFAVTMNFRGPQLSGAVYYDYQIYIPKVNYTASTVNLNARNRIVQKVDWRAIHSLSDLSAMNMSITNLTSAYTTLVTSPP
jgi:hypothetical protein